VPVSDAVVIGAGHNGLVAAAVLARAGWEVAVLEGAAEPGGAVRSGESTVPGYLHDHCSGFHPMLWLSPVLRELELDRRVAWANFATPVGAVVAPDRAAVMHRDVEATAAELGGADGQGWWRLWRWWEAIGRELLDAMLAPLPPVRPALRLLRRGGVLGALDSARLLVEPMAGVARRLLVSEPARALLACGVIHSDIPIDASGSVPAALMLAVAGQAVGMPIPRGGAGRLTAGLVALLEEAGGLVHTGAEVRRVTVERGCASGVLTAAGEHWRARRAVVADLDAGHLLLGLVGAERLPRGVVERLALRRHGSGMFRVDLALRGDVPWVVPELHGCGVVHLCGDLDTTAESQHQVARGLLPARPMLICGQHCVADPGRAPAGGSTLWLECHAPAVPRGDAAGVLGGAGWASLRDGFVERILTRLEEHAPGVRERVAGCAVRSPTDLEAFDPNLVGGDVAGGSYALDQQVVFRPLPGWSRHRMPVDGLYLCSASAHPGGGVHGMPGRNCARRVLADSLPGARTARAAVRRLRGTAPGPLL
jgi:phytoene dehydrogenase-like protein